MSTKIRITSQYLIVRALSDKFQNICVVGDDAQSIYAFSGAIKRKKITADNFLSR
jgi:superfamily I DNA/RNA helicase